MSGQAGRSAGRGVLRLRRPRGRAADRLGARSARGAGLALPVWEPGRYTIVRFTLETEDGGRPAWSSTRTANRKTPTRSAVTGPGTIIWMPTGRPLTDSPHQALRGPGHQADTALAAGGLNGSPAAPSGTTERRAAHMADGALLDLARPATRRPLPSWSGRTAANCTCTATGCSAPLTTPTTRCRRLWSRPGVDSRLSRPRRRCAPG